MLQAVWTSNIFLFLMFGILRFLRGVYSERQSATKTAFQTGYRVRESKRVWDFPNKPKRANGYSFAVLAPYSKQGRTGKEWNGNEKSKMGKSW